MASLADDALTTVQDVKESLGLSSGDSSKDNLIRRKINQATDMIENYCGRSSFKSATYTEDLDGTNTSQLVLRNRPVTSVTSISTRYTTLNEDSFELQDTELYFVGNKEMTSGVIDLNFTALGGYNRYRVVYAAGYSGTDWPEAVPADLQEAAATLAAFLVSNGTSGTNVRSKQEGQRRIEFFDSQQSGRSLFQQLGIDEILDAYANHPVYVA